MSVLCKKFIAFLSVSVLLFTAASTAVQASESTNTDSVASADDILYSDDSLRYTEYISAYDQTAAGQDIVVDVPVLENWQTTDTGFLVKSNGEDTGASALVTPESGSVTFDFTVPESRLYAIKATYLPITGSGSSAVRELQFDGVTPYYEASIIEFPRVWANQEMSVTNDILGNDILPLQVETPRVETLVLENCSGLNNDTLYVYLEAGKHSMTMNSVREPLAICSLQLISKTALPTYQEVREGYQNAGYSRVDSAVSIQGEDAAAKSDATMLPLNDKTSPLTQPASDYTVKYNTIGGSNWQEAGQWLEWSFTVPESGLYSISMRYRQNLKSNSTTYRRLYVDGEIPFAEANMLEFAYSSGFTGITLGDSNGDWLFYFEAGTTHTIRLEVTTGEFSAVLEKAQTIVNELNEVYRQILMITGPSPDLYRDYDFPSMIPETLTKMGGLADTLDALQQEIQGITGWKSGSNLSAIQHVIRNLRDMVADDTTIAGRFSNFQDNISSFAAWVLSAQEQPLTIDYFVVSGSNTVRIDGNGSFFGIAGYQARQFLASFVTDYNALGTVDDSQNTTITVWLQTGRDQSQIIRQLINQDFSPNSGISVKLQLVSAGSLLSAIVADLGPDVALQLGQGDPMNYAFRNAVQDLSVFDDVDEVMSRFSSEALIPFQYKDSLYALPESQSFQMLFYRKDILAELGIKKSDLTTWDSMLKVVIPELQKNYLSFGLTPTLTNYAMLLMQNGGSVYNEEGTASLLNSKTSLSTFTTFTKLYTEYLQPYAFDFANRFRTGQMPIAVMDLTAYNQLSVFAPEIAGLWDMQPLPATVREDGTLDHTAALAVSACTMFKYSSHKEESWEFMKWWTSANVQTQYGKNMESLMGTAARYNSANLEAFQNVSWDKSIRNAIDTQMESVKAIPEIPGGYYTTRYFDFAFRDVVNYSADIRESLNDSVKQINDEITGKREEFGLD